MDEFDSILNPYTTEIIFTVSVLIFSFLALLLFGNNVYNLGLIFNDPLSISNTTINLLYWTNIIWAIIALIILIYSIVVLIRLINRNNVLDNYLVTKGKIVTDIKKLPIHHHQKLPDKYINHHITIPVTTSTTEVETKPVVRTYGYENVGTPNTVPRQSNETTVQTQPLPNAKPIAQSTRVL